MSKMDLGVVFAHMLILCSVSVALQITKPNMRVHNTLLASSIANNCQQTTLDVPNEVWGWDRTFSETFLSTYLQKKPLVVRQAFQNIATTVPLQFADLVDMAADDDVFARLYRFKGKKVIKEYGPFTQGTFDALKPASKWSLLLQEVDRHVPAVADIWNSHFSFMPNWRRDDVMVSYSLPGGSIGAHVDNYDVFLMQRSGTRTWSIENSFLSDSDEKSREVEGSDTRLLRDFSPDLSWDLHPGDMLYLPPRIPHHGITTGKTASTTISVGFRAPNYKSLITALWDDISTTSISESETFYGDVADLRAPPPSPGLISPQACDSMRNFVTEKLMTKLGNEDYFNDWLGKHLTTPLRHHLRQPRPFFMTSCTKHTPNHGTGEGTDEADEDDTEEGSDILPYAVRSKHSVALPDVFADASALLQALAAEQCALRRAEGVRMAYIGGTIYIDGEAFPTAEGLGSLLCDSNVVCHKQLSRVLKTVDALQKPARRLLTRLLERGYFYPIPVRGSA